MSRYTGEILYHLRSIDHNGFRLTRYEAVNIVCARRSDILECYSMNENPAHVADWFIAEHFEGANNA